ncbi:MAG: type IV secretion system DNA-binding domain-containing protein [Patescibacteria group bacterium]|nr:type IV secretion system DNA-binding domain-containing protein [Patescibacteria group bacterium]
MDFLFIILSILVAGVIIIALFLIFKKRKITLLSQDLGMVLFSVKMPKYEKKQEQEKQDIKNIIGMMEQIYSNFLYLKKPNFLKRIFQKNPRIALEIASETGESDILFYVAVPNYMATGLEKYIQGVYPEAQVEKIPQDYTIFEPDGKISCSYLKLKKQPYFPLNTYRELESDPLAPITNSLSKIYPNEGAGAQFILKPSSLNIRKSGEKIVSQIMEGKDIKTAIRQSQEDKLTKIFRNLIEAIFPQDKKEQNLIQQENKKVDESVVQAIKSKIQKPVFDVNIRLIACAQEQWRADEILNILQSSFSQFYSSFNSFNIIKIKKRNLKRFIYEFSFRIFNKRQKIILNLTELTSVYHFPLPNIESPNIKWVKTKEQAPPLELPITGSNLIGKTMFRQEQREVYFANADDRRRHSYIVGQTGTGKSSLLQEMIRQDIEQGKGVGVIDPHGDLIEKVLANIPKHRIDDVVLFEPSDLQRCCGLNMLEWESPEQKDFAVSEMIAIFSKLFPPEIIGPMFEHYMRNAMLALMADKENPGTLVEISKIFTDKEFMEKCLAKVSDPLVRQFWIKEWGQTTGDTRSDMLGYVVSKVGRFVENEMMRNIIGQTHSGFNLSDVMNQEKIFLANLSKGQTGELNSSLLGLILVSKMQLAAMRRGTMPEDERKDFYLYIDEFQNFTTDTIAVILSEARKYRLNLILAHQFIPQLSEEIKNAVIGNVGTMSSFRVGAVDAEFLEKQFEPEFSKNDLINLDNFEYIMKMMIKNKISSPFKVKTIMPKQGNPDLASSIKKISKLKHSRPRILVEREIMNRSK